MEWKEAESVVESYARSGGHMVDVAAILSASEDLVGSDSALPFFAKQDCRFDKILYPFWCGKSTICA